MTVKSIAGHDLHPGKIIKDHIHVDGTELHIPHVLLCGQTPGPTLLITAGIHNAEYVGIQAAIELSNELEVSKLHGNVIIVPLANRSGFENRTMSRVFEDGKNLNRVFPGNREGSEAERLAYMLFEVFIKNVDAYIDDHYVLASYEEIDEAYEDHIAHREDSLREDSLRPGAGGNRRKEASQVVQKFLSL